MENKNCQGVCVKISALTFPAQQAPGLSTFASNTWFTAISQIWVQMNAKHVIRLTWSTSKYKILSSVPKPIKSRNRKLLTVTKHSPLISPKHKHSAFELWRKVLENGLQDILPCYSLRNFWTLFTVSLFLSNVRSVRFTTLDGSLLFWEIYVASIQRPARGHSRS